MKQTRENRSHLTEDEAHELVTFLAYDELFDAHLHPRFSHLQECKSCQALVDDVRLLLEPLLDGVLPEPSNYPLPNSSFLNAPPRLFPWVMGLPRAFWDMLHPVNLEGSPRGINESSESEEDSIESDSPLYIDTLKSPDNSAISIRVEIHREKRRKGIVMLRLVVDNKDNPSYKQQGYVVEILINHQLQTYITDASGEVLIRNIPEALLPTLTLTIRDESS